MFRNEWEKRFLHAGLQARPARQGLLRPAAAQPTTAQIAINDHPSHPTRSLPRVSSPRQESASRELWQCLVRQSGLVCQRCCPGRTTSACGRAARGSATSARRSPYKDSGPRHLFWPSRKRTGGLFCSSESVTCNAMTVQVFKPSFEIPGNGPAQFSFSLPRRNNKFHDCLLKSNHQPRSQSTRLSGGVKKVVEFLC